MSERLPTVPGRDRVPMFPNRVWYPTGSYTEDGKPKFASRECTPEDRRRRWNLLFPDETSAAEAKEAT